MAMLQQLGFYASADDGDDDDKGVSVFCRANDADRLLILSELHRLGIDEDGLNCRMAGAFIRQAWTSEPYLDGVRYGSFISAFEQQELRRGMDFDAETFIRDWANVMMEDSDREALGNLEFPLTIYRGGLNDEGQLNSGWSWTMSQDVAEFYATKWLTRWGRIGEGAVISMQVDEFEVAAYLGERNEQEILLSDLSLGEASAELVPIRFKAA